MDSCTSLVNAYNTIRLENFFAQAKTLYKLVYPDTIPIKMQSWSWRDSSLIKAVATLTEDPSSVPGIHLRQFIPSTPMDPMPLASTSICRHTYPYTTIHTYTQLKLIIKVVKSKNQTQSQLAGGMAEYK